VEKRDALGADLYASVFGSLICSLPHPALQALNICGHAFVNGGSGVLLAGQGRPLGDGLREFGSSWRWSAGVGLIVPTWFGRFEANWVRVLSQQEHDRSVQGLQFGFASNLGM
jgi:outer membrane protein insertion porin family